MKYSIITILLFTILFAGCLIDTLKVIKDDEGNVIDIEKVEDDPSKPIIIDVDTTPKLDVCGWYNMIYWSMRRGKLVYYITVDEIVEGEPVVLGLRILQDTAKKPLKLFKVNVEETGAYENPRTFEVIDDTTIGEESPLEMVPFEREYDLSSIIDKPGTYLLTLTIEVEKSELEIKYADTAWMLYSAYLFNVHGKGTIVI